MIRIKQAGEQAGMQPGNRAERTDGPSAREWAARLRACQPARQLTGQTTGQQSLGPDPAREDAETNRCVG